MIKNLLLGILLFVSVYTFGQQDKKWSVEANYGVIPQDGFGGEDNITDLGIKYRFADFDFIQLGFGINGGFSRLDFVNIEGDGGLTESFYIQPRIFSEFIIPGSERLRPSIGLGYSWVQQEFEQRFGEDQLFGDVTNGGFNLNIGLSYDITKRLFVQAQYDFINLNQRDEFTFNGELVKPDSNIKLNNIKLGLGFRF